MGGLATGEGKAKAGLAAGHWPVEGRAGRRRRAPSPYPPPRWGEGLDADGVRRELMGGLATGEGKAKAGLATGCWPLAAGHWLLATGPSKATRAASGGPLYLSARGERKEVSEDRQLRGGKGADHRRTAVAFPPPIAHVLNNPGAHLPHPRPSPQRGGRGRERGSSACGLRVLQPTRRPPSPAPLGRAGRCWRWSRVLSVYSGALGMWSFSP